MKVENCTSVQSGRAEVEEYIQKVYSSEERAEVQEYKPVEVYGGEAPANGEEYKS